MVTGVEDFKPGDALRRERVRSFVVQVGAELSQFFQVMHEILWAGRQIQKFGWYIVAVSENTHQPTGDSNRAAHFFYAYRTFPARLFLLLALSEQHP